MALVGVMPLAGVVGFVGLVPTAIATAESTEEQEDETMERLHRDHVVGDARQRTPRYQQSQVSGPAHPARNSDACYFTWVAHVRGNNTLPIRLPLRC